MTEADKLFENCKLYHPYVEDDVVSYTDEHQPYGCILIWQSDGTAILYDDNDNSIRNYPYRPDEMSEENFKNDYGRRLEAIMKRKGIMQEELSAITGISQTMISRYITHKSMPSMYNADLIAKALDCSMDDFRYF